MERRLFRGGITVHKQHSTKRWWNSFTGFRTALTRVINKYTSDRNNKKNKITLSGEDIKEGLTAVLSIKMPDPKFSSQTKDKLVSSEIRNIVEHIISEKVSTWFDQNPSISKVVLEKLPSSNG